MIVIETPRLALRTWTPDDAPAYLEVYGDERVTRFTRTPSLPDIAAAGTRLAAIMAQTEARGFGHWALIERGTGAIVGSAGFRPVEGDDELEVGFTVAPSQWGKGYAVEGTRACLRWGFDRGAKRIRALTMPANTHARRVLETCGMKYLREVDEDGARWCLYECTSSGD